MYIDKNPINQWALKSTSLKNWMPQLQTNGKWIGTKK